ncbi:helix-turn-helix domain-containing protein [Paenibacillus cymbidii]|uniref:helix-turn-helix domain-containing protein n=1 Tax=Paenibacillus cymbidii TaxID=1639034 RepID=UPI00107FF404|nr:AraC family transcriptional regulator [Paenibacillus cymbidii]
MKPTIPGTAMISREANWDLGFHDHDDYEISVVVSGKGRFQCLALDAPIERGDVVMIPPNLPHRYFSLTPIRFCVLQVKHFPAAWRSRFAQAASATEAAVLRIAPPDLEQYVDLFRVWLRMYSRHDADRQHTAAVWGELLLLFVAQHAQPAVPIMTVSIAADTIRRDLAGDVRIAELARLCGLSESSFRRSFHAAYGASPKQYQQRLRLSEAKWLLRSHEGTLQEIGALVGFSSVHAFSAWFQHNEGVPPSEWRKREQGL